MALLDNIVNLLNLEAGRDIAEQIRKLSLRLYPYLILDFAHKEDVRLANAAIYAELEQIKTILRTHVHPIVSSGIPGAPEVAGPTPMQPAPTVPAVVPTDAVALSQVLPSLVPQPGNGTISLQPTRIDPQPIQLPPLDPLTALETLLG